MESLIEILDWEGLSSFSYPNMYIKKEIADGSCFFHSFLDSFYLPYINSNKNDKIKIVSKLRFELSQMLSSKNDKGLIWYDTLSRGKLKEYSKVMKDFELINMQKTLNSTSYVDNRFNEYVSNVFDKNIFILHYEKKDVYITGKDNDILYKNRKCIVLIWIGKNHYDLVGILEDKKMRTLFNWDHPFIIKIREKLS